MDYTLVVGDWVSLGLGIRLIEFQNFKFQVKSWQFMPELSKGSLDDEITTINIILLVRN
jgi:hypothetical protein